MQEGNKANFSQTPTYLTVDLTHTLMQTCAYLTADLSYPLLPTLRYSIPCIHALLTHLVQILGNTHTYLHADPQHTFLHTLLQTLHVPLYIPCSQFHNLLHGLFYFAVIVTYFADIVTCKGAFSHSRRLRHTCCTAQLGYKGRQIIM